MYKALCCWFSGMDPTITKRGLRTRQNGCGGAIRAIHLPMWEPNAANGTGCCSCSGCVSKKIVDIAARIVDSVNCQLGQVLRRAR